MLALGVNAQVTTQVLQDENINTDEISGVALQYYQNAVNGNARAQCNLGYSYEKGQGVP